MRVDARSAIGKRLSLCLLFIWVKIKNLEVVAECDEQQSAVRLCARRLGE